jgi:hypothetical protein
MHLLDLLLMEQVPLYIFLPTMFEFIEKSFLKKCSHCHVAFQFTEVQYEILLYHNITLHPFYHVL